MFDKVTKKDFEKFYDNVIESRKSHHARILDLDLEIEKLKTHINSLRGLINKKLKVEIISETETTKSVDGLDSLRVK